MPISKWLKRKDKNEIEGLGDGGDNDDRQEEEEIHDNGIKLIYFASTTQDQNTIDSLRKSYKNLQTFTDENQCLEYIKSITDKVLLIIDNHPSTTFIESIEPLKQIDSVFFSSPSSDTITTIRNNEHTYRHHLCENYTELENVINKSYEELNKQTPILNMYNKEEKPIYYLPKDQIAFTYFQSCKLALKNIPKIPASKQLMIKLCRSYYRGNLTESTNIDEFDKTYKSCDAIAWFIKDTFLYKLINKTLRTENFALLFLLNFYITDLSEQLELECKKLKAKQKDILKLYRPRILNQDKLINYQNNIGNLISNIEYLSTTSKRSFADNYLTKLFKQEGFTRVLIEYTVDLNVVRNIVIADVQQYSSFPEEAEFIIDTGASFEIISCEYNTEEDFWHIKLNATDKADNLADQYIQFQKGKMSESNTILYFGNLLIEMGEYTQAEQYFDTVLCELCPNDDEIAGIFFYFGRIHRMKGDLMRAIACFHRAYSLLINARPKRIASAGKAMNGLGVVYYERGHKTKAEECFQQAMDLYEKNKEKNHVDVADILVNLGIIDYNQQNFEQAINKYQQAKKIYDSFLPSFHPYQALLKANMGNVHLAIENYKTALEEYETVLKLQQTLLPANHIYISQILRNLAVLQSRQGNTDEANKYLERAQEIVNQIFPLKHPIITLDDKIIVFPIG